jgi:Vitamin K-dependent gamma-carboxylase
MNVRRRGPWGWLGRIVTKVREWVDAPMPVLRLELIRALCPLFILGFMSGRLIHADEWIGDWGFRVPHLAGNPAQPLYLPPLPSPIAWLVVTTMVLSGLALSVGWRSRASALVFAATLAFVALSDPLAAFTVSKIGPVIAISIACGPAGSRYGIDARRRRLRGEPESPSVGPLAPVRFLQLMLVTFYCASGIAKAGGDWLLTPFVLWTHLHDTYQTAFSYFVAKVTPPVVWTPLQHAVLCFEVFAPLWFAWSRTRLLALLFGLGMHTMIGLMFGPVIWFALLMMALLAGCFAPASWLERVECLIAPTAA